MSCSEKACPFLVVSSGFCFHHLQMFGHLGHTTLDPIVMKRDIEARQALKREACKHPRKYRNGRDRQGLQKMICRDCGAVFSEEKEGRIVLEHCYLRADKVALLVECYKAGKSARMAAEEIGIARRTAVTHYHQLKKKFGPVNCPCGRPGGHQGWCSYRVVHSPARRAFLQGWRGRQLAKAAAA